MKPKRLLFSGICTAIFALAIFSCFSFRNYFCSNYSASEKNGTKNEISNSSDLSGEAKWDFDRIKNQNTGQLDWTEMLRIQELSNQHFSQRNSNPSVASNAQWTELGPDNVGGRTRAILFDNQDPTHQHMFAGGVGGGLWESTDAGNNWHRCAGFFSVPGVVITVVTIAQASNGDLYVGTGEGDFYYLFGYGPGGLTGDGIYKSTDDGISWNVLPSTQPTNQNSSTAAWICINKIACDPVDSNLIYAGTNKGFKESVDGGINWFSPTGINGITVSTDVAVGSNGNVVAIVGAKPFLSIDHGATFTNVGTAAQGFTNSVLGRTTVAIAPSNPNYVYCFCADPAGALFGMFVSIDGANTWAQVTGAGNSLFDPFANLNGFGQGTFDNVVTVDPVNPGRAIFGGEQLWEWDMITNNPPSGQWTQIASDFQSIFNPTYVGEDKHAIVFQPGNPTVFYIGTDNGIFRTSNNGSTYVEVNSGYNVTQCFSVACDHLDPNKRNVLFGTQDQGTQFIDGFGNTPQSARKVSGAGVGGDCALSFLNTDGLFETYIYGFLFRSSDRGISTANFYSNRINSLPGFGLAGFANFRTPISLWESTNDLFSKDSIRFTPYRVLRNLVLTNGDSVHYSGVIQLPAVPIAVPAATVVLDSLIFVAGQDTLFSDAFGNLSGDGTGMVQANGNFSLTFNILPAANVIIKTFFYVHYNAGTIFSMASNITGRLINYTSSVAINPGDTLKVQDIFQSHLAVGFTGNNGIWMTKQAIDFSINPTWIKIGGANSLPDLYTGESSCLAWSNDGNNLFVGTSSGNVYRFSNLQTIKDSANGDVDYGNGSNPNCVVTCTLIGDFPNRYVTALDVNPNNSDEVIVSLGNYGNIDYVYYSSDATTATNTSGTFTNKTGNLLSLGACPAYSISFDKYVNDRILVGTEHGIFETLNLSAGSPTFTAAMNGLDNVAVETIHQQRWEPWEVTNAGCFYIATHGRGIWRDDSSWQQPNGINEPTNPNIQNNSGNNHDLKIFPNPVSDNSNVIFNLAKTGSVTLLIFDLNGKVVLSHNYEDVKMGNNSLGFETSGLAKGTYILVVSQAEKRVGSGRFIKVE